jgi:hypothetical protein
MMPHSFLVAAVPSSAERMILLDNRNLTVVDMSSMVLNTTGVRATRGHCTKDISSLGLGKGFLTSATSLIGHSFDPSIGWAAN